MTEPSHPDTELELASAYLDGGTTDAETAAVEGDAHLLALVDDLDAVRTRMPPQPSPPGMADRHVAAALDTLGAAGGEATVLPLGRGRREPPWYQRIPLTAAAAVFVLVALIGAVALTGSGGDDDETAADSGDVTSEALSEEAGELDATAGRGSDGAMSPSIQAERLQFADLDALAAHLEGVVSGDDSASAPEAGAGAGAFDAPEGDDGMAAGAEDAPGCDPVAAAGVGDLPVLAVVGAELAGRAITAVVVEDDGPRMVVVDDAGCDVVDERRL